MLETIDQSLNTITKTISFPIKRATTRLIAQMRNGQANATPPQETAKAPIAVALVTGEPMRTKARSSNRLAFDSPLLEQLFSYGGLVLLTGCQDERDELAIAFGANVDFRAQSAPTAA